VARLVFPPIRGAGAQLAIAFLIISVVAVIGKNVIMPLVALAPGLVIAKYFVWQPFTYGFIETSPTGVIFGAIILWSIGGVLESDWGRRRLFTFALATPAAAGLVVVAMAFFLPKLQEMIFAGGTAMTSSLWVAYGLRVGRHQTNFWGMPVSGNILALIGVGFVFLDGAFNGWLRELPAVIALAFTFAYVQWGFPAKLFARLGSWRLQRRLNKRSSHLSVVSDGQRNMPQDSDKYLH
jgi:membrane associated rhomboid family serine protease